MTDAPGAEPRLPAPRRYGDREVARILERATELQRAEPSVADPSGLTLAELTEIAREAGIEPSILRRAAAELDVRTEEGSWKSRLAGAPWTLRLEREVAGELPPDRFDAVIPLIQQGTHGQGTASAVGRTLTWSSQADNNSTQQQVLVSSADGRTLIRWEERFTGAAIGLFAGLVGGGGVGIGIGAGTGIAAAAGSAALGLAIPVAVIGGSYAAARAIFRAIVRRRERTARAVMADIARYVEAVNEPVGTGTPGPSH